MKYSNEDLINVQKTELIILKEIIRICEKYNISYFTVGGTTLGAVRHNGFIPWDDDIDIGMMRDDYDRFISLAQVELREGFSFCHFSTEYNTPPYFAKVRKDGTLFVEAGTEKIKMNHGIFVDIMPYDKIPTKEVDRKKYRKKVKIWNQLYIAKSLKSADYSLTKYKKLYTLIRTLLHFLLLPVPKVYLYKKLDKTLKMFNDTNSNMVSSRGLKVFECEISDLIPPKPHLFENMEVLLPHNSDKVLRTQYGDYMKLPPEDMRYSHAPVALKL